MKTHAQMNRAKKEPPHLTYSAFCLPAREQSSGFSRLTALAENANSLCPVKRKRALLESNPPRDNWSDGDEIKRVSTFGEANTSPNTRLGYFYFRAGACLKNSFQTVQSFHNGQINQKPLTKTALAGTRFFEASAL
jgi:hypothetical protein